MVEKCKKIFGSEERASPHFRHFKSRSHPVSQIMPSFDQAEPIVIVDQTHAFEKGESDSIAADRPLVHHAVEEEEGERQDTTGCQK